MSTPNPGTTNWVPLWDLNGGIDLRYLGDWVSGSYRDGDVTIYQGTAYVCVRPTTAAPTPWATSVALGYGTTLPASPYNGQEYVLVDSTTAPTFTWRFRHNANSTSTYKWEFVGGSTYLAYEDNDITMQVVPTYGPQGPVLAIPRAGYYCLRTTSYFYHPTDATSYAAVQWATYPGGTVLPGSVQISQGVSRANAALCLVYEATFLVTPATQVCPQFAGNVANMHSRQRQHSVIPVRVS